jgi:hypothetical protein
MMVVLGAIRAIRLLENFEDQKKGTGAGSGILHEEVTTIYPDVVGMS